MSDYRIETKCVQGGYTPGNGEPRQIPIVQSTTFKYATSEDMGKLFDLEANGYFYTRLQNPTNDYVAAKICELEGGTAAMLTSSGQAANFFALFNICSCGDHIVSSSSIYGGTFNLISVTMAKMGIEGTFVSPDCTDEELEAAFRPNTKAVFGETIANPALTVLDIEKFAKAAHAHGVPLIVDNTFATPVNCRPFEWGADIVTHSTTKYMDGHGAAVGGAIVDSGKFDWMAHADKFPGLCTPDDSYHGITYAEKFGREGAFITKCTAQLMRDFGATPAPQNAYYLNIGLETIGVLTERGAIVTVSSMWGVTGGSCEAPYSAAKAGVIGLTKALAQEELMAQQAKSSIPLDLSRPLEEIHREIARRVLRAKGGNRSQAAASLGIARSTLWRLLKKEEDASGGGRPRETYEEGGTPFDETP